MLTRDEVLQLILYLVLASVLLLAGRVRAEATAAENHPFSDQRVVATKPSKLSSDIIVDRKPIGRGERPQQGERG